MKSLGLAIVAAVGALLTATVVAVAQGPDGYPDLRGQWQGTSESVVVGTGPHNRSDTAHGQPRIGDQRFTLKITRQEGPKFWGELVSKGETTTKIGVIASDKQTIFMVDNVGGHNTGKLIAPNEFEACYERPGQDHFVVGCTMFRR
jgi:hypothetical protein